MQTKKKWTLAENKKLFKLHIEMGNKWKKIADHFQGRTDNSLKNNFFSIIRKALRSACKVIGKSSNTNFINRIKPKVLSKFVVKELFIDFKEFNDEVSKKIVEKKREKKDDFLNKNINENSLEKKDGESFLEKNGYVSLEFFVEKFAFERFAVIYSKCGKKDIFCIKKCLQFLIEIDREYENKKGVDRGKNKNLREIIKIRKEKKNELSGFLFETSQLKDKLKKNKNKSLDEIIYDLKKSIKEEKEIRKIYKNSPHELKRELILQFEKIQRLSQIVLDKIWMASEQDLKRYSKNISMPNLLDSLTKKNDKINDCFLKNSKKKNDLLFLNNSKNENDCSFLKTSKINNISFLNNSKNKNDLFILKSPKIKKNKTSHSPKNNKLINSFLKIPRKKKSNLGLNNSLAISGFGCFNDSNKFTNNNANIAFNDIFSKHIKNVENPLLKSNAIDPILSNLKDSGKKFNLKNSEIYFNMKNSGIEFNMKNSGLDFNLQNSGMDFNMKNSGIDLLKSKFSNQFFDFNKN